MLDRSGVRTVALLLFLLEVVALEFALEFLDSASCIDEGLASGKERVGPRPDFNMQFRDRSADGHDHFTVVEDLARGVIGWVSVLLHRDFSSTGPGRLWRGFGRTQG